MFVSIKKNQFLDGEKNEKCILNAIKTKKMYNIIIYSYKGGRTHS